MPNRIRQHIPPYFDPASYEPKEATFDSLDELLAIPWVASWKENWKGDTFHRYSVDMSGSGGDRQTLMCERDDGYKWWVIGFLETPIEGLPEWKPRYRSKADADRRTQNRS